VSRRRKSRVADALDGLECCGSCLSASLVTSVLVAGLSAPLGTGAHGRMSRAVQFYRTSVSPGRAPVCRMTPTCSTFARDELVRSSALLALTRTTARLLACARSPRRA
jgi:hypothetical protein